MSKKDEGKGKKSVVSKKSYTSEFLHNAWGTNNQQEETWENIKDTDDWNAKSEVKDEDWASKKSIAAKDDEWSNWGEEKSMKENLTNNDAISKQ